MFLLSEHQTKTPTRIFFYISVENVSICTKFSGYVCEELGIPSKSNFNIHCIQIFIVYRGSVKRIIYKPVNMMSELLTHSNEYLIFMSAECLIPQKHTLQTLFM